MQVLRSDFDPTRRWLPEAGFARASAQTGPFPTSTGNVDECGAEEGGVDQTGLSLKLEGTFEVAMRYFPLRYPRRAILETSKEHRRVWPWLAEHLFSSEASSQ